MAGNIEDLAEQLFEARRTARRLPAPDGASSIAEAYAVQRACFARRNMPVMVWKLGLTADAPRRSLRSDDPVVGRLAASDIYVDRSETRTFGDEMFAEAELIFELGGDLPPSGAPYSPTAVAAAVKGMYAGIELAATRFTSSDLSLDYLISDNCLGHALVLGDRLAPRWLDDFANMDVELERSGHPAVTGSTANVMGNPLSAATWLANWLAMHEDGLKREQLIASGTCTGITQIFPGDVITARFPGRGQARVSLTAD